MVLPQPPPQLLRVRAGKVHQSPWGCRQRPQKSPNLVWDPFPSSRRAHLQSGITGLVSHGHPGDAGKIKEGQIWNLRGGDLQTNELVANANSIPSYDLLGSRDQEEKNRESK